MPPLLCVGGDGERSEQFPHNVRVYEKFRRLPYYFTIKEAKFGWKKKCNLWKLLTHFFLNLIRAV